MPCMCGDIYCRSCGPAQGNSRCSYCGAWAYDLAEMFDEACEPDMGDFFLAHEQWHIDQDGGPEKMLAGIEAEDRAEQAWINQEV